MPPRPAALLVATAVVLAACAGPRTPTVDDPLGASGDEPLGVLTDDVLSPCAPVADVQEVVVVAGDAEPPSVAELEAELLGGGAAGEDLAFMVEERVAAGVDRRLALLDARAQVVGGELFDRARALPGFVRGGGRYASPSEGVPFELAFTGDEVPAGLEVDDLDLGAIGLVVTLGAVGEEETLDAFSGAYERARALGIDAASGQPDVETGTGEIQVVDATPEQVAAWEDAVEEPDRWCMVLAPRSVACDDDVVAAARAAAPDPRPTLPNVQPDGDDDVPSDERAAEVRASYLGLTVEQAEAKAAEEDRAVRVTTRDGVALGSEDDLQPGRLSLTACDGVVTDTRMDLEGFER